MQFREVLVLFVVIAGVSMVAGTISFLPDTPALSPEELATAAVTKRLDKSAASRKEKDLRTSVQLLLPLAQSGNAEGQFQLGLVYREDETVALLNGAGQLGTTAHEDHANARKWLLAAAEQGHLDAQATLGIHYCWGMAGEIARTPSPEGIEWLLKAAKTGHVEAQRNLATTYRQGLCVTQDAAKAAEWFLAAATQGDEWSMVSLANMTEDGEGVPADKIQSRVWTILAGLDKDMKLRNRLPPDERAEVERRLKEWLEKHPGAHHE